MTEVSQKAAPRLKQRYADEIKPALLSEFGFANVMQVPGVVKVIQGPQVDRPVQAA